MQAVAAEVVNSLKRYKYAQRMSTASAAADPQRPPRVVDVAREAGVSPGTVSNVYNRPEVVREELRVRVLESAARLGFGGGDPTARSLRSGRAHALGVVFRERLAYAFEDPAAVAMLQGVSDAADPHQLALTILPAYPENGTSSGSGVRNAAVDSLLLYSLAGDDPLIKAVVQRRLPTVVIDAPAHLPEGFHFVGVDDHHVGRTAAEHLFELGHRNIGLLSLRLSARDKPGFADLDVQARSTSDVARSRLAGAATVVTEYGLDWRGVPVVQCQVSTAPEGRAAAQMLLDSYPDLTAILALSDSLALGALAETQRRGLSVPADLSIVGIDDTAPEVARLTTIRQPHRDKGRIAADLLIRQTSQRDLPTAPYLLPTELIVRGSTGINGR